MPAVIRIAGVIDSTIDGDAVRDTVLDERAGAVATFAGVVRNHDDGKGVTGIEYVGHPTAADVMAGVLAEFTEREGIHAIAAQHRVGSLGIGDVALYVAVAASHRKQAFACTSDIVDRLKETLPIWKKQFLADGGHEWSQCP